MSLPPARPSPDVSPADWPAPPPGGRVAVSLRGRLFVGWMIALGGIYLAIVVALLVGGLTYMDFSRFWETVSSPDILFAMRLSLLSSLTTVALALVIGIPAGYVLSRYRFPGKLIIDTLLDIPIVLPPLVVGVLLLIFFHTAAGRWIKANVNDPVFQPEGVVLAQFVVACAFGIRMIKATFDQIDPRLESVARTLGATRSQAFFRVTLPMARSGVLAAAVVTWARAIGEFGPILIFGGTMRGHTEVLPTSIWLELQVGDIQAALAVTLLMILLAMTTLLLFKRFGGQIRL